LRPRSSGEVFRLAEIEISAAGSRRLFALAGRGSQHQMMIDWEGWVRFVHYGHSMSDIPENSELLKLLDQLIPVKPN